MHAASNLYALLSYCYRAMLRQIEIKQTHININIHLFAVDFKRFLLLYLTLQFQLLNSSE